MKKLFCALVSMLLLLSLAACGGNSATATEPAPSLQVGYSKVSIVPQKPLALSSSNQATYEAVYEDVYMTCIAITDIQGETILLFTTDISYCSKNNRNSLLKAAEKATGIGHENMFFSCTHNHSGLEPSGQALSLLKEAIVQASTEALADRKAAGLSIATTQAEGMNFVRHYQTDDGHWVGDNYYSPTGSKAATPERAADATVQLMRFDRKGASPVLLMNWQAHGTYSYKLEYLCADFIGSLRTKVEADTGCLFAYFQGAAGNLNPVSNTGANKFEKSLSGMTQFGQALAEMVIPALENMTAVTADDLELLHRTETIQIRYDDADMVIAAGQYRSVREEGGSHPEAIVACGELLHGDQGAEYVSLRSGKSGPTDAHISAIRLGEVAFVVAPYEMFDDTGLYIRENSPFTMTFILGYTNGRLGYIPSKPCIDHGCYEYEGSYYEAGTAEALAEAYLQMLSQLHGETK